MTLRTLWTMHQIAPMIFLIVPMMPSLTLMTLLIRLTMQEINSKGLNLRARLLLALLLLFGVRLMFEQAAYTTLNQAIFDFLLDTAILSIGLGLFNLVPIPPLDGSKVLAMFLPDRAYAVWMRYERYGMLVLLVLSFADIGSSFISNAILGVYSAFFTLFY